MSRRLERLAIWLGAAVGGSALGYGAVTAPTGTSALLLGVLIVLGTMLGAVGVLGFANEVVGWINRALPDQPSAPTYKPVVVVAPDQPEPAERPEPRRPRPAGFEATMVGNRVFVDVSPDYLAGFYKTNLGLQANKLAAPYIGKWVQVTGQVRNVLGSVSTLMLTFDVAYDAAGVYMNFDPKLSDKLAVLAKGQRVTVAGRITQIDALGVTLGECELVSGSQGG